MLRLLLLYFCNGMLAIFCTACASMPGTFDPQPPASRTVPADKLAFRATQDVEEPLAFYSTDSTKFAFHIKHEDETGNDVFYWGWNPPFVNYDITRHSAAFSLERNYQDNIEWNLDIRGAFGPTETKYQSRPIHAMINANTGFPKTLDFTFGRIAMHDLQLEMDARISDAYAYFSRRGNYMAGLLELNNGLRLTGGFTMNNVVAKPPEGNTPLIANWAEGNLFTFDLEGGGPYLITFAHAQTGQTVRLVFHTAVPARLEWESRKDGTPLLWPNGEPVTHIGGKYGVTVFSVSRVKLTAEKDAFIIYEVGAFGEE